MLRNGMVVGWLEFWMMVTRIAARCALVAGVALATYTMLTRGMNG